MAIINIGHTIEYIDEIGSTIAAAIEEQNAQHLNEEMEAFVVEVKKVV